MIPPNKYPAFPPTTCFIRRPLFPLIPRLNHITDRTLTGPSLWANVSPFRLSACGTYAQVPRFSRHNTASATLNSRWLTTATGKLGSAWNTVLLYGKAGGAWVGANNPNLTAE
jgi:hypothetical protein